jgi:hypothetical protein
MADPLGGDQFDVEGLAEAEIEKLLKQVCESIKFNTILNGAENFLAARGY